MASTFSLFFLHFGLAILAVVTNDILLVQCAKVPKSLPQAYQFGAARLKDPLEHPSDTATSTIPRRTSRFLEVMSTTSMETDKRKHGVSAKWSLELLQNLKETLLHVTSVLQEHNVVYWLDYGTALGAYRHHNIIPWDADTDIGILESDHVKVVALKKEIELDSKFELETKVNNEPIGSFLRVSMSHTHPSWSSATQYKDRVAYTDIYHYRQQGKNLTIQLESKEGTWPVPRSMLLPPSRCNMAGVEMSCPHSLQKYLRLRFKFLTPNHKWNAQQKKYVKIGDETDYRS